jgi:membrane protein
VSEPAAGSIRGLPGSAWRAALLRAWHGFMRHRGIDSAAALSFFSAVTFFPASLAVVAAFELGAGRDRAAESILDIVAEVVQPRTVQTITEPITQLFEIGNPWLAFAVGVVLAIWSLSAYATAFGRAVNSVYEVHEGRKIWRFRGTMLLLAAALLVLFAAMLVLLLTTPRIIDALDVVEPWRTVWNVGRWPALLLVIALIIATLYYVTPAVRHDRMRWVSTGAAFAIVAWALATLGFAVYVAIVDGYDRVYGWLGGGLVLLLWLYVTNLTLVLGAEVDAELVRLRQLRAGIPAEEVIQLPMRDTARNLMLARQRAADVEASRRIREQQAPGS